MQEKSPWVEVIGPDEMISGRNYRAVVEALIEGWTSGADLRDVLVELQSIRPLLIDRW
ncbi:MAG: hypothetical protein QM774_06840 [Gordonia sp. (in: high G+C Gram-positive bacteria)]|uniref:hypothetical protein n=1 Tax=Gordonia sp. (in: high G+C Gram-positive bacteria) TaxID=84139 RepID=UPI0039E473F2